MGRTCKPPNDAAILVLIITTLVNNVNDPIDVLLILVFLGLILAILLTNCKFHFYIHIYIYIFIM